MRRFAETLTAWSNTLLALFAFLTLTAGGVAYALYASNRAVLTEQRVGTEEKLSADHETRLRRQESAVAELGKTLAVVAKDVDWIRSYWDPDRRAKTARTSP